MKALVAMAAAAGCLAPALAQACPACAQRESGGTAIFALIGALIAVPYLIAAVTLKVIRHVEKDA